MSTINSNSGTGPIPGARPLTASEGVERTLRRAASAPSPRPPESAVTVAPNLDADLRAFQTIQQNLSSGTGLVTAAIAGANSVSRLLGELRATAAEAANPDNAPKRRAELDASFAAKLGELRAAVGSATYNDRNLLAPGAESVTLTAALTGGQLTIESAPAVGAVADALAGGVADPAPAAALLGVIDEQVRIVDAAREKLGASQKSLEFQSSFVKTIADASATGVGALVEADLAAEAAKIRALQVKQQLGGTSLGIANQRPQNLLSLFDK
jgi:flagellin